MIMNRKGDYNGTYTGKNFYPLDPRPEDVCIEDIAHALSQICRFNGHMSVPYDVASHSCNVQRLIQEWGYNREVQLYGLLHDAHEAYTGDFTRPLKSCLPGIKEIENNIQIVIFRHLGLIEPSTQIEKVVKDADDYILALEARQYMKDTKEWNLVETKADDRLWYTKPFGIARTIFIMRFDELLREAKR
jgi:hypothetical protein